MLELKNIHKKFQDFHVQNINLKVNQGDYYVILGKSGAGKTILLESIAGLLIPDHGSILLHDKDITHCRIQNRKIGLVFQDYAIFPHKTVEQNIAYPLRNKKLKRPVKTIVRELASKTGVDHLIHRYPETLSGGEIQRTVLARTLALEPEILLLDEPLTSLDIQFRRELQGLLRALNADGQTIIHVTHDFEEALALANRVAVLNKGELIQEGDVHQVFQNPRNKFIADFVGIRNFFHVDIFSLPDSSHKMAKVNDFVSFSVPKDFPARERRIITIDARNIILSKVKLDSTALNNFEGTIKDIIPIVSGLEIVVDIGVDMAVIITQKSFNRLALEKEMNIWISFKASAISLQNY